MKYQANSTALSQSTDCLIIGIYENNEFTKSFNEIDQITKGYLSQLAQSQDLSGKIGQATLLHSLPNLSTKRVLVAGCGKKGETTERQFKQIIQRVTQTLKELNIQQAVNNLTDVGIKDRDLFWNVRFTVETIEQGLYQFDEFKSKKADAISLQEIVFNTDDSQAQQAITEAQAIANGVKAARNIANMPPNICTPAYLAEQAKNLAETSAALSLDVIDVATLTGACVVALGQHNSGLVSTNDALAEQLLQAAQQTTDKAWHECVFSRISRFAKSGLYVYFTFQQCT